MTNENLSPDAAGVVRIELTRPPVPTIKAAGDRALSVPFAIVSDSPIDVASLERGSIVGLVYGEGAERDYREYRVIGVSARAFAVFPYVAPLDRRKRTSELIVGACDLSSLCTIVNTAAQLGVAHIMVFGCRGERALYEKALHNRAVLEEALVVEGQADSDGGAGVGAPTLSFCASLSAACALSQARTCVVFWEGALASHSIEEFFREHVTDDAPDVAFVVGPRSGLAKAELVPVMTSFDHVLVTRLSRRLLDIDVAAACACSLVENALDLICAGQGVQTSPSSTSDMPSAEDGGVR